MTRLDVVLVLALAATIPTVASAQDTNKYTCTLGDLTRRVEVVAEPGVSVPCEVHYYKDDEMPGERQVLWSAQNEQGFCEARAQEFAQQLSGWGWNCGGADVDSGVSEPPPSLDSGVSEPPPSLDSGVSEPPPLDEDEEMLGDPGSDDEGD